MELTTKQLKYSAKRLEVLRAAARVFGKLGVHRASVGDVAEELGITPAALYYYIKSKDELLHAASSVAVDDLRIVLDDCNADTTLTDFDRLQRFFRAYAAFVCSDFGRCLALTNADDMPSPYREDALERRRTIDRAIRGWARGAISDGLIGPTDDAILTRMLFGGFNAMARWWSPGGQYSPEDVADHMLTLLRMSGPTASATGDP